MQPARLFFVMPKYRKYPGPAARCSGAGGAGAYILPRPEGAILHGTAGVGRNSGRKSSFALSAVRWLDVCIAFVLNRFFIPTPGFWCVVIRDSCGVASPRWQIGRILEDLDALAGNIAFKHCSEDPSFPLLVTASVDR